MIISIIISVLLLAVIFYMLSKFLDETTETDAVQADMERVSEDTCGSVYREMYLTAQDDNIRLKKENERLELENGQLSGRLKVADKIIQSEEIKRGLILQSYGEEHTE